jgi:hypothetical protein
MDEDPRFPNRKKKRDWDDMSALDKPLAPGQPLPDGEPAQLPENVYHVVESAAKTREDELRERQELYSYRQSIPVSDQAKVETPVFIPIDETPVAQEKPQEGVKERISKFAESQTRLFAAIGLGFVILIGITVAVAFWTGRSPEGRYDLGMVTNSAAGLKGHLFVEWDKQLDYRLSIEPDDPARHAAFAAAVANSPHPLSVEIHLQDSGGFVLCSREVLLKYDAKNGIDLAPPGPDAQGGKSDAAATPGDLPASENDPAQTDAAEAAREKGKEIFKNQVGADGQIAALAAQGSIPCTARAYEKAVAWSFSPNFPAIAEQDALLERLQQMANGGRSPAQTPARSKIAAKPVQKLLPFSMEGDDAIVDFDASRGIIETNSGKVFFIDKAGGTVSDPRWQDYPVPVHYRCDRGSECTLMHAGTGSLHVRLRR